MKANHLLTAGLLALTLAACGGTPPIPDPEPRAPAAGAQDPDARASGMDGNELGEGEAFGDDRDDDGELAMVVYFDFDE